MSSSTLTSSTVTPLWTEGLLRKLLLAKDINDVHFHLFSRRSKSRALDPRVLNANTTLLKSTSKYFIDLFSLDAIPSNTAMMKVKATDKIFDGIDLPDYGYESDSDLEDDTGIIVSLTQTQVTVGSDSDNDDSDNCVPTTPSLEKYYDSLEQNASHAIGLSSGEPVIQPTWTVGGGRHIFVKDAAFQTWYCLLHFLYMGTTEFSLLRSSGLQGSQRSSCNTSQVPKCSAKSMYRLATKLSISELHDRAFAFVRNNINENNLLQELASGFTRRHPAVLEMELDLLLQKIADPPIVEGLPKLMSRISQKELSHGADIMAGFYTRILEKHYFTQLPTPTTTPLEPLEPVPDDSVGPVRDYSSCPSSPSPAPATPQPALTPAFSPVPFANNAGASSGGGKKKKKKW
ncbi:hypothetical protein EDC04DRAFT_1163373 [Pisolithus marmoratus]|nr:hypothetical protein EDC04DRAFT_1163373 [Pisolithus marmoratus]